MMATALPKDYSLPPELAATALRELGESPAARRDSLRELRQRIFEPDSSTTDTVDASERLDDAFLLRFLRCKKFDVHKSQKVYEGYAAFRQTNGELVDDVRPQAVQHVWESGVLGGLRSRDRRGRSVIISFAGRWRPDEQSEEEVLRAFVLQLEHLIESDETQVNGIVLIADFAEFSFYQTRCLKPWYFHLMISLVQVCVG